MWSTSRTSTRGRYRKASNFNTIRRPCFRSIGSLMSSIPEIARNQQLFTATSEWRRCLVYGMCPKGGDIPAGFYGGISTGWTSSNRTPCLFLKQQANLCPQKCLSLTHLADIPILSITCKCRSSVTPITHRRANGLLWMWEVHRDWYGSVRVGHLGMTERLSGNKSTKVSIWNYSIPSKVKKSITREAYLRWFGVEITATQCKSF